MRFCLRSHLIITLTYINARETVVWLIKKMSQVDIQGWGDELYVFLDIIIESYSILFSSLVVDLFLTLNSRISLSDHISKIRIFSLLYVFLTLAHSGPTSTRILLFARSDFSQQLYFSIDQWFFECICHCLFCQCSRIQDILFWRSMENIFSHTF